MPTEASPAGGKRVALVLGAGGARGLAHIGAIEELLDRGYRIVAIAGTSQGALVGGIYAAGKLKEYADWASGLERGDVFRLLDIAFGRPGFLKGERVIDELRRLVGDYRIEDLPIPYTAVATDLRSQREVWINEGPLFDAIRASIAIPMLFTPAIMHGREMVDGGLLAPIPLAAMRQVRSDLIVAVDVNGPPARIEAPEPLPAEELAAAYGVAVDTEPAEPETDENGGPPGLGERITRIWDGFRERRAQKRDEDDERPGLLELMSRSLDTMQARIARLQLALDPPDLLIQVPRDACSFYEYWRARELIERGRRATEQALNQLEISP
jgi:NTE family protein